MPSPPASILAPSIQRNGADYAVYINTGQEFDGSDSGARPDEAMSWGKIRGDAEAVKVSGGLIISFRSPIGTRLPAALASKVPGTEDFGRVSSLRKMLAPPPYRFTPTPHSFSPSS